VETFAALQLEIDSWRWKGVPFYIWAGKCLPVTCAEIIVRFRQPPTMYSDFKANFVTASNEEEGFAQAIERFVLNQTSISSVSSSA
jgi:glucose-6-phosphate 1-dehydrogenase